jgi:hypothetical protein
MDKLAKYNQKLLAIIGTTIIALAAILLVVGLIGAISLFTNFSNDDDPFGIQVNDVTVEDVEGEDVSPESKQVISFLEPIRLDTIPKLFIIPVGQVNMEQEKRRIGSGYSSEEYRYDSYYGLYNNFILFDYQTKKRTKIFEEKIALSSWANIDVDNMQLLLFRGADQDFNNDGVINPSDFQSLYAYYLDDKKLEKYSFEGKTVLSYELMYRTNLIAIRLGIDKNKDANFDSSTEPQEILILDVKKRSIEELIPSTMADELRDTFNK